MLKFRPKTQIDWPDTITDVCRHAWSCALCSYLGQRHSLMGPTPLHVQLLAQCALTMRGISVIHRLITFFNVRQCFYSNIS